MATSYHHQSNAQAEESIKFIKCTITKCLDTNNDVNLALIKIPSTPIGIGLPSPAMFLFNRPIQGLIHLMSREPININDDLQCKTPKYHQDKYVKNNDTKKTLSLFPKGPNGQTYNWEHKTHVQQPINNEAVPLGTNKERHCAVRTFLCSQC